MRRARVFLAVAALVAVLAGCQVDAHVDVTMAEDGSGAVEVTVTLDEDAAARVPNLAEDLRVRDLEATGWEVTGPTDTEGGVEIVARKPFANAEQGREVLREIGGRGGLLRALTLRRDHTFAETSWAFGGTLDLSAGLATFSDEDLEAVLGSDTFGQDQASLEEQLGEPLADTMSVTVSATLPEGDFTTDGEATGASSATWTADLGDDPVRMAAESSERDTTVLALAAVSAGALVLLVLLLLFRVIRGGVRRRRQHREDVELA
ncbi:MAG: hypothetical protein JNK12_14935 [Acidimicrobiales bacterium]|nr:hypothetical protein [Acidimicrobiales bacterium]